MEEMKMRNEVHIKIGLDGVEFNAKGDSDFIERERNAFEAKLLPLGVDAVTRTRNVVQMPPVIASESYEPLPTAATYENEPGVAIDVDLSRTSLASFVKTKGADAHYDFIICAVYFNEKKNGIASFSSAVIKELYSEAKKPMPNNLSMSLSELVKKGLIMEDASTKGSAPKMYVLTIDGEESVTNMHPTDAKEKKSTPKSRKQRPKVESIFSNINCDELHLDQYPDVKPLKVFKEKMMLILYIITNEDKGEWFTTADVLCLMTDIFGETATINKINGVFKREKLWFKVENIDGNNKLVHRKLLNNAKAYAQSLASASDNF